MRSVLLDSSGWIAAAVRGQTAHAASALDSVLRDPTHVLLALDPDLVASAVQRWIVPFRDQNFSLCDAVSFEVMQRRGVTRALSIDRYFIPAGFEIIH